MKTLEIAEQIKKLHNPNNTLIIGIDGLGGAGKSTISEKLCKHLKDEKYSVTLLHIDDFIHPRAVRYNDNYAEWECYYNLQWRYDYLLNKVIAPLKSNSDFITEIEFYDKK